MWQVTFQARDLSESRHLYDQLAVFAPIMLALSAASPIFAGRLADTDVRWSAIAQSVDDRTPEERGLRGPTPAVEAAQAAMAGRGVRRLPKSRYDSISTFICNCMDGANPHSASFKYNDIDCPVLRGSSCARAAPLARAASLCVHPLTVCAASFGELRVLARGDR